MAESVRQHLVAGSMHHGGDYVVLVRAGVTPSEATLRLAAIGRSPYPGTIEEQRQVNAGRADEALDLAAQAATAAGRVDPHLLDERDAVAMADQLGVAINELAAVCRRLARRGRQHGENTR